MAKEMSQVWWTWPCA